MAAFRTFETTQGHMVTARADSISILVGCKLITIQTRNGEAQELADSITLALGQVEFLAQVDRSDAHDLAVETKL
jgi:hypothetical protein